MKAIVAMDLNRVIGYKGQIPWKLPDDFKWFKIKTMGGILVMGSNTFNTVGCLPFRFTFVLTNDPVKLQFTPRSYDMSDDLSKPSLHEYVNLDTLLLRTKWIPSDNIWLCGGEFTYKSMLSYCDELYITHVLDEFEGDTFFPPHETLFPNSVIIKETSKYWIVKYTK